MMEAVLNQELYGLLGPMTPERFHGFKTFMGKLGLKRFAIFDGLYKTWLSEIPSECRNERDWLRSHISTPYMPPYPDKKMSTADYIAWENGDFRLLINSEVSKIDARSIAWAANHGGVAIGYPDTPYNGDLRVDFVDLNTDGGKGRQCLHLTVESQVDDPRFLLWRYVSTYSYDKREVKGLALPDPHDFCKHFNTIKSNSGGNWTKEKWVEGTKDANRPALFLPGLKYLSRDFYELLIFVLKIAYQDNRYDYVSLNGFVLDVGNLLGAAAGKPTPRVELYITQQNIIHLRPTEKPAMAAAPTPFCFSWA